MNNKVKLAIAVAVGIVGGGLIGTFGGGESKVSLLGSGTTFPEWTRNGSAFRCKNGKVQGCIGGTNCGTSGRTGTTQPVAVCQKCVSWIDMDDLLTSKPDYDTNMLLQVDPNYGPQE